MEIHTGRPVSRAPSGMVTSPHSLASAAGVEILKAGGSAVDAAIATSAVLAIVYPHMTSIGGDAFWLIYDSKAGRVRYLNGGGRAAAKASLDWFKSQNIPEIPFRGVIPATLTVPGAVASWAEAHASYGRLPLARSLQPAIGYASDGVPVTGRVAAFAELTKHELSANLEAASIFLPKGEPIKEGHRLVNSNLARSLQVIADSIADL